MDKIDLLIGKIDLLHTELCAIKSQLNAHLNPPAGVSQERMREIQELSRRVREGDKQAIKDWNKKRAVEMGLDKKKRTVKKLPAQVL